VAETPAVDVDLRAEQPAEDELITLPRRAYPPTPSAMEQTERTREKTRGRIAYALIGTLVVIVVGTFAYILFLSFRLSELSTENLMTIMQNVGTTLLAPLVGLIGAVIGFYYGGQTAVQAANQATQAASQGAHTATQAATQGARTATEATEAAGGPQRNPNR
jgi:hypothetical protein